MKVLFLQNLEHNNVGDIKDVPDGYARNYLLKRGIAVPATEEKVVDLESKMEKIKREEEKTVTELTALAEKLEADKFTVEVQAGEEGKLFGAVTNRDIAAALEGKKYTIDKQEIEILEPIHDLGDHTALVKLGHGIHATIKVRVERAK